MFISLSGYDTSETPNKPDENDFYFVAMKETKSIVEWMKPMIST